MEQYGQARQASGAVTSPSGEGVVGCCCALIGCGRARTSFLHSFIRVGSFKLACSLEYGAKQTVTSDTAVARTPQHRSRLSALAASTLTPHLRVANSLASSLAVYCRRQQHGCGRQRGGGSGRNARRRRHLLPMQAERSSCERLPHQEGQPAATAATRRSCPDCHRSGCRGGRLEDLLPLQAVRPLR